MENWCYDKPTLYSFAKHYQTGEPLPTDMFERLKAAKTFRSATQMLRQVSVCGTTRCTAVHSSTVFGRAEVVSWV
jgi:Zn-dependent oligopeptidase